MGYLQTIKNDPFVLNSVILVSANEQDLLCICYFIHVLSAEWLDIKVIHLTEYQIGVKACKLVHIITLLTKYTKSGRLCYFSLYKCNNADNLAFILLNSLK